MPPSHSHLGRSSAGIHGEDGNRVWSWSHGKSEGIAGNGIGVGGGVGLLVGGGLAPLPPLYGMKPLGEIRMHVYRVGEGCGARLGDGEWVKRYS